MFIIRKAKSRPWPITFTLQEMDVDGNIVNIDQKFIGHFKPMSEGDWEKLHTEFYPPLQPAADGETQFVTAPARTLSEQLDIAASQFVRVFENWDKVADEDKNPIPYSPETLRALVTGRDGFAISAGIRKAISDIRYGAPTEKNSPTSPPSGQATASGEVSTNSKATSPASE